MGENHKNKDDSLIKNAKQTNNDDDDNNNTEKSSESVTVLNE